MNVNITIAGKIQKVIYQSPDTAYVVAIVADARSSQTVCGIMPDPIVPRLKFKKLIVEILD